MHNCSAGTPVASESRDKQCGQFAGKSAYPMLSSLSPDFDAVLESLPSTLNESAMAVSAYHMYAWLCCRWANGIFKSTLHRVVNLAGKERYSTAFFFEPNFDTVV